MAKDQAPSAPLAARGGSNPGRGPKGKPPARTVGTGAEPAAAPKPPFDPIRFFKEVRAEARKTTWTSPKETWITSVMVFIMVLTATAFFLTVDWGVSQIVQIIVKIGA
jgi:preprotein translocase subunit SecE